MIPELIVQNYGSLPFGKAFPPGWKGKKLPGAETYSYTGKFGSVVVQEVQTEAFVLRYLTVRLFEAITCFRQLDAGLYSIISLKGEFRLGVPGREDFILKEGQFQVFQAPRQEVRGSFSGGTEHQLYTTLYRPVLYREWLPFFPKLKISRKLLSFLSPPVSSRTGLADSIRDAFLEEMQPYLQEIYYKLKVKEQLLLLLAQSHHPYLEKRPTPWQKEAAQKARAIIAANIQVHYSNVDLAELVNMDRSVLSRAFRLEFGMGMHEYLVWCRFEKAKELLKEGLALKQVAREVGYSHTSTFSYEFRKFFGYSPVDFQKGRIAS